jgi:hypothetical protein
MAEFGSKRLLKLPDVDMVGYLISYYFHIVNDFSAGMLFQTVWPLAGLV